MELLAYFRVLRRRWALILLLTIVGGVLGAASTQIDHGSPKSRTYYKAAHTLVLNTDDTGDSGARPSITNLDQMAILATTPGVADEVAKKLGSSQSGRQLAERIVTTVDPVTNTLDITAVDPESEQAVRLADAFAGELVAALNAREQTRFTTRRDALTKQVTDFGSQANSLLAQLIAVPRPPNFDTLQSQYDATQKQYSAVYGELQQLLADGAPQSALASLTDAQSQPINASEYASRLNLGALGQNHLRLDGTSTAADASASTSSSAVDSPGARGALGAVLGFLVGVGLALMIDRLDRRVRTRKDVEAAFDLPVLADVPTLPRRAGRYEIVSLTQPMSETAEAYRAVQTSLQFQFATIRAGAQPGTNGSDPVFGVKPEEPFVVMVTSALPGEGKSATAANLAVVFAETGSKVLVVNCDFRRPTAHRYFDVEDVPRRVQPTAIDGVQVITNVLAEADSNPAQYVAAQRQVVTAAKQHFDTIILDTAPILAANDAVAMTSAADLVLLVARTNLTTSDAAQRGLETLDRVDAALAGVVFLGVTGTTDRYSYYGYGYGGKRSKDKRSAQVSPSPAATNGADASVSIDSLTDPGDDSAVEPPQQPATN